MFRRPAITILLLTDGSLLRADFSSGKSPRLLGLWESERGVDGGLAAASEVAAGLGPKIGRRVVVLSTAVWTQTIAVRARSVDGMSDAELAQTLKFEVESFSGVGAFESNLAFQPLAAAGGEERVFWVAQIDNGRLTAVEEMIAGRGGKLIGVCHPAGVPDGLTGEGPVGRLEFWRDLVCGVAPRGVFISNNDPRSDRWQTALENWEQQTQAAAITEWLVGPRVVVPHADLGEPVLRLDDRVAAEQWLAAWARHLAGGPQVPIVRPARRPVSRRTKAAGALAAAAVALVACTAHWSFVRFSKQAISRQLEQLKQPEEEKKRLEKAAAAAEKREAELQRELAALQEERSGVAALAGRRNRLADLLAALAEHRSFDVLITHLSYDRQGVTISGESLAPGSATRLAAALRAELAEHGWRMQPPDQVGRDELTSGGPWSFSIVLVDGRPAGGETVAEAPRTGRELD